jgi:hypothetical protein
MQFAPFHKLLNCLIYWEEVNIKTITTILTLPISYSLFFNTFLLFPAL